MGQEKKVNKSWSSRCRNSLHWQENVQGKSGDVSLKDYDNRDPAGLFHLGDSRKPWTLNTRSLCTENREAASLTLMDVPSPTRKPLELDTVAVWFL